MRALKRLLDMVVSFVLLVMLAPLALVTALLIRIRLGSPVLFLQPRIGKDDKIFTLLKFRTMREAVDAEGRPLPDAERLTAFGQKLRSLTLDELPQLLNILKGDMSLVGPRPLLMEYLGLYSDEQRRRHEVRPGITGWAQVNGRNALDWPERLALDVWYVDNQTFLLDLKILWMTELKVVARDGINAVGEATMYKFQGER